VGQRRQRGYALILVLGALALITVVAARFAERIDLLRAQSRSMLAYADGRIAAAGAVAVGQYWVATREGGAIGYGQAGELVRADGTVYALQAGATLALQDQRGLISVNVPDLSPLARLLRQQGLALAQVDTMIDGLLDYIDGDSLRRLNGAEAGDYARVDGPAPRNDWLLSVTELAQVLAWRDQADLVARLQPVLSARRIGYFNPNTAPRPVLRAWFPAAAPEQIERLMTYRQATAFANGAQVQAVTGLPAAGDEMLYSVSDEISLTVSAPGLPRPLQYNLILLPGGENAPWLILQAQARAVSERHDDPLSPTAFPLALGSSPP
jgi:type II secretory pathway component PulK